MHRCHWPGGIVIEARLQDADGEVTEEEWIRFFNVLAHDLKSPIFAVDGFSELLVADCADSLDEDGQDYLGRIRGSALYMKRILDDMSRLVTLLARPNAKRRTPLHEIVEEALREHNPAVEQGAVTIDIAPDLPVLDVDPEKIREVISALLANALFFTDRPRGERRISIDRSSAGACDRICIRDNGTGIDPRYISHVFELGGISKLDKSRGGGPGYGLYLAKRLIECHGGELTVDSVFGEGSAFCFTIPK